MSEIAPVRSASVGSNMNPANMSGSEPTPILTPSTPNMVNLMEKNLVSTIDKAISMPSVTILLVLLVVLPPSVNRVFMIIPQIC